MPSLSGKTLFITGASRGIGRAIGIAAARQGNGAEALRLHQQLLPLMDALFFESNPIPLKAALKLLGLCEDGLRLPLVPASAATRTRLAEALCLSAEGTFPGVF